jgi:hypothetical protein
MSNSSPNTWANLLAITWLVASAAGCDGPQSSTTNCAPGAERCACYGNGTCNVGLVCLSELCVADLGGVGGNASTTQNPLGNGGSSSSTTGSGGAPVTPSGGAIGVGGVGNTTPTATGGAATTTTSNLIKNGDFSLGKEYWDLTYQSGQLAGESYSSGAYCVSNESSSAFLSFSLGYPPTPSDAFAIKPNSSFTLSYRAYGVSVSSLEVKIGQVADPYTPDYSVNDTVSSSTQTFAHVFSSTTGDPQAGLVFNGVLNYSGYICFDDVSVVKN